MLHVALCADARMSFAALTVVRSIARLNGPCTITFHFLHDGSVPEECLDELRSEVSSLFARGAFVAYERHWRHGYIGINPYVSRATMLRLLLPEALEVPRAIYLDLDLVVYLDLHELWSVDAGATGVAMRPEVSPGGACSKIYRSSWFEQRISGNAGVMVLDLELLRRTGFSRFCASRPAGNDQSAINDWCAGRYAVLPRHCNLFRKFEAREAAERYLRGEGFILHYNRPEKPWDHPDLEAAWLWWRLQEDTSRDSLGRVA